MNDCLSITEIKVILGHVVRELDYLSVKDINRPFEDKDYKTLQTVIDSVNKIYRAKWTKEYY